MGVDLEMGAVPEREFVRGCSGFLVKELFFRPFRGWWAKALILNDM